MQLFHFLLSRNIVFYQTSISYFNFFRVWLNIKWRRHSNAVNVIFKIFISDHLGIIYFTYILALSASLHEVLLLSEIFILIFSYLSAALINWLTFIYWFIICFDTALWSLYSAAIIMEMQDWSKIVIYEFHYIFLLRILTHLYYLTTRFVWCRCKTQLWLILFMLVLNLSCIWIYTGQVWNIIVIEWLFITCLDII